MLQLGDYIAVIAPAGVVHPPKLAAGLSCLREMGFVPVLGKHVYEQNGFLAGSDAMRTADLQWALTQPHIAAIWAARGGYGSTRVLNEISAKFLHQPRPLLIGFSDVTALHCVWHAAQRPSLHAVNIEMLADLSFSTRDLLTGLLLGKSMPQYPLQVPALYQHQKTLTGTLTGGNLTVLASLCGTNHSVCFANTLLFLEDVNEVPYRLDRALWQLKLAGCLNQVKAVILGEFWRCAAVSGPSAVETLSAALTSWNLKVFAGLAVGHQPETLPLPLGVTAYIDCRQRQLSFQPNDDDA